MRQAIPQLQTSSAAHISLAYCVAATGWLLLSEQMRGLVAQGAGTLAALQWVNGLLFVAVTGLLLYRLVSRLGALLRVESKKAKCSEETIRRLTYYDQLTNLPNRRLLVEHLTQDLATRHRTEGYAAILKIDLDRFSLLNDASSRSAGDTALIEMGTRIAACVPENGFVARLANDEFAVFVQDLGSNEEQATLLAKDFAHRLMATIRAPIRMGVSECICTACVGVRLFSGAEVNAEDLLRQAHAALHAAKEFGRENYQFYNASLQATLDRRIRVESLLRSSGPKDFVLHYQPQVSYAGHSTGFEALLRWRQPGNGLVTPNEFIHLAEETGFILPLGHWVLESACQQLKEWELSPDTAHLSVGVNVSAKQLAQPGFVEEVIDVVRSTGANPARLDLELTESMLISDVSTSMEKMKALKAHGICFSLDDFGTGFSSLTYLRQMPLDKLKIDQSFVADIHRSPSDAAIARTVISLGQSLGLGVIAEGVEKLEQLEVLAHHGCNSFQGFLFGRPAPAEVWRFSQSSHGEERRLH